MAKTKIKKMKKAKDRRWWKEFKRRQRDWARRAKFQFKENQDAFENLLSQTSQGA